MRPFSTLFLTLVLTASAHAGTVRYAVDVADPARTHFHVEVTFEAGRGVTRLFMPDYTPGSLLQNNARYVSRVRCVGRNGERVAIDRVSANAWEFVLTRSGPLTISYDVTVNTVDSLRLTTNSLGPRGGFFHGTTVLLGVQGRLQEPCELEIGLPQGWRTATALPSRQGTYHANSFRELVMAPLQFGLWTERRIQVADIEARLVFDEPLPPYDEAALDARLSDVLKHHIRLFGGAPFHELLVLFHWRPDLEYGGGVTRRSTIVMNIGKEWMEDLPANMAGTFAHEAFHTWNFASFYPHLPGGRTFLHQLDSPDGERFMWFIEGVTNYYVLRTFARIGRSLHQTYLDFFAGDITQLERSPARDWVSLEEAGAAVWSEPLETLPLPQGGEVAGLILDLAIRDASHHRATLDDFMRDLYRESQSQGYAGYTEESFLRTLNRIAGRDITEVFGAIVRGKGRWDYDALFRGSGLSLVRTGDETAPEYRLQFDPGLNEEQRAALEDIFSDR